MKIDAKVQAISKLKDYFFLVPDYQREYVWTPDDEVEQFLIDIENEYIPKANEQRTYFLGSIIIVNNGTCFDVVDGQQWLTTIMLSLCAFRDLLKEKVLNSAQKNYLQTIENLLYNFDIESGETRVRLELQYEESYDYLTTLIQGQSYDGTQSPSISRMQDAYMKIRQHLRMYDDTDVLIDFIKYFLTRIELVVIESQDLSSALKIFETINQRGVGLNAMDLVKNLLFCHAKESDFAKIKDIWKEIIQHLQDCHEDQNPLRFLRYFLVARYYNGILREDDIYKWIISPKGKQATGYETHPVEFAKEISCISKRYSDLVKATELQQDGGEYPHVTNIGFINKYKSRQHLILLLSLGKMADTQAIEYLAEQIESFFFYSATLRIQAKNNESLFVQWAEKFRGLTGKEAISSVVRSTMLPYLLNIVGEFKAEFLKLSHGVYNPLYRLRYVLGKIENTVLEKTNLPRSGHDLYNGLQIEHIFPQTPKNGIIPSEFTSEEEYYSYVYRLGNVTLLEGVVNQAVNNYNDLSGKDWFSNKQQEYGKSAVCLTKLLDNKFAIGVNTALNRFRNDYRYDFAEWNKAAVDNRQKILLNLVFDTWRIDNSRLDQVNQSE